MLKRTCLILIAFMLIAATQAIAAENKMPQSLYYITNYETHSQQGNYDFMYNGLVFTKRLQPEYSALVTYLNKFNLDTDKTDSHVLNLSLNNTRTKDFTMMYSFSHYSNPKNIGIGRQEYDADRWLVMGQYKLINHKSHALTSYTSYATATDFSDSRSINQKFKYGWNWTEKFKSAVFGQYSYNLNQSDNLFNLYGLDFNYQLSKTTRLNANYMFVDIQTGTLEDDNIFKVGMFRNLINW